VTSHPDPDARPNLGAQRVAAALSAALGGAVAGGFATAGLVYVQFFWVWKVTVPGKELSRTLQGFVLTALAAWAALCLTFSLLRAFVPARTTTHVRAALWLAVFVPIASIGSWIAVHWAGDLLWSGVVSPWRTIERMVERTRPYTRWEVSHFFSSHVLAGALPLAAAGLLAGGRLRHQLGLCAAAGLLAGLLLVALQASWMSLLERLTSGLQGFVPVVALASGLLLARLVVPTHDPRG